MGYDKSRYTLQGSAYRECHQCGERRECSVLEDKETKQTLLICRACQSEEMRHAK